MKSAHQPSPSPALTGLALALLLVGLVDAATVGWLVARDGVAAHSATIGSPALLWALWVGVILTVLSDAIHRKARYLVALGALVGASFRAGLHLLVVSEATPAADPAMLVLRAVPPVAGSLILAAWAGVDAVRRRPVRRLTRPAVAPAPTPGPVGHTRSPHPVPAPQPTPARGPRITRSTHSTHSTHSDPVPAAVWKRVGSPWPRAVEEDPDGTLLRPPRRRSAL